ncbi:hypothetical protein SAMN05443245_7509 [Paraburkholderia fungorum]|uniref:Uncharacterized protein n=2 Tax=Paraburkholderia fungorum TaxID=134537 RepID=A0A1H1JXV8_9BURK|nr:hypothetical protein SAMN05443245_7509 [Paraburkholderia fungorum]
MLSLHEVATLLLIKDAPDRVGLDSPELGALSKLELVDMGPPDVVMPKPRVSARGHGMLRALRC